MKFYEEQYIQGKHPVTTMPSLRLNLDPDWNPTPTRTRTPTPTPNPNPNPETIPNRQIQYQATFEYLDKLP